MKLEYASYNYQDPKTVELYFGRKENYIVLFVQGRIDFANKNSISIVIPGQRNIIVINWGADFEEIVKKLKAQGFGFERKTF